VTSAPGAPATEHGETAAEAPAARGRAATAAAPETKIADPHRRVSRGPRLREKLVIVGYRVGEWILGRLPLRPAARVGGWASVASYWAWPEKRHIVEANCAQVLGLPRNDRRVGRLARQVYRNQVRWVLEMMRMHRLSRAAMTAQVDPAIGEAFGAAWRESNGLIVAAPHFGNNEAGAAGLAGHGWPFNAVADDSAYEDLFNHFVEERHRWGIEIVPWRNLRGVFRALRRKEILVLLVDWGYRADGIPARFFGEWTTFPAGPAVLAAKTGATIVAVTVTRDPAGIFHVEMGRRIMVTSNAPAELQRATQEMAEDLETLIRRTPEQWVVFKPMWPARESERAELARRVAAGDVGGTLESPAAGRAGDPAAPAAAAETA
jgi:phosphatidylinositol dimannoside acyltransferase